MTMHLPPHPGAFIKATYLSPFNISVRQLAKKLDVSASTINRLINGESGVSPEMAYRLSGALGRSPESWLVMQAHYDLWIAKKPKVQRIDFDEFEDAA
ncbi:MAG: HigA family addiction module antidote protein [Gammaproteobacteria bacterium]|nr:HigA family addiction module antidote protein [Gammaproteobacteria bacterium]